MMISPLLIMDHSVGGNGDRRRVGELGGEKFGLGLLDGEGLGGGDGAVGVGHQGGDAGVGIGEAKGRGGGGGCEAQGQESKLKLNVVDK